jgi:FKBP-type peptidyl-prolyl cis-trans isomerase 2
MVRPLARDEEGLSTFWSFVGVLVLIFVVLAVYVGVVVPRFPPPAPRALPGDTVTVDYVGSFEDGLIFDTSLASVAADNASRPKAFSFSWRPSWSSLTFQIGKQPPQVIRGFELGVQGLAQGEQTTVSVPSDLGYGSADPAKIQTKHLLESVPVRVSMNASEFRSTYGTDAVSGTAVRDPVWGWPATVDVAGSFITVTNSPVPGTVVRPYDGWDATVVSIDDGANGGKGVISVQHHLSPQQVDRVGYAKVTSGRREVVFVVTAVDVDAGTFTLNFNDPTRGRPLIFQITMVHIARSF